MINEIVGKWGLLAIIVLSISNGFFSTPPSEILYTIAGSLTTNSILHFWGMFLVVVMSNFCGTALLYLLSRNKGKKWYDNIKHSSFFARFKIIDNFIPTSDNLIIFFSNKEWLIFACRFVPFIRSIISVPAGIAKMNPIKYSIYSLLGISIWCFAWLFFGRIMIKNIAEGKYYLILVFVFVFSLICIISNLVKRKVNRN